MAFTLYNWSEISSSLNQGVGTAVIATPTSATSTLQGSMNLFNYFKLTDSIATISAANYFLEVIGQLSLYDWINVRAENGTAMLQVTAITQPSDISAGTVTATQFFNSESDKYAAVPITAVEFNGMFAAPKILVAAGGANTLLVLKKVQLLMTYNSAAYASGGVAAVQYDVTANGAGVIASTTLAAATFFATESTGWNFNAGVVAETFSTCVNKSLSLSNITGAFTTGNSPMVAHVWYSRISTI